MTDYQKKVPDPIQDVIYSIQDHFSSYSVKDIAETLFVSSLWLPNISSSLKHQILIAAFITSDATAFSKTDSIETYADFKSSIEGIYPLLPSIPQLEDYIPQLDWGDVRYFYEDRSYKIFYGCNLETVYDFLYVFQLMFAAQDEIIQSITGRSPSSELIACLKLQDTIISCIDIDRDKIDFTELEPGHLEVPPESFWLDARAYYNAFDSIDFIPEDVLKNYSVKLGSSEFTLHVKTSNFLELASSGKLIEIFFVEHDGKYYSVLPRMFSEILMQQWNKLFTTHKSEFIDKINYQKELTLEIMVYVKQRHKEDEIFALPSPVSLDSKPDEPVFACAFRVRDSLYLIYVAQPVFDSDTTEAELEKLSIELRTAIELLAVQPTTLALHMDRQYVAFQSEYNKTLKPEIIIVLPIASVDGIGISIPKELPGRVMFMHEFLGLIDELDDLKTLNDFYHFLEVNEPLVLMPIYSMVDKFGVFRDTHGLIMHGAREFNFVSLDPHWGSHTRYETLKEFWLMFPAHIDRFLGHPRRWAVVVDAGQSYSLISRNYIGRILMCNIADTLILINSPLHLVLPDTARLADLLTEALQDSLKLNSSILAEHYFFQSSRVLHITIFPSQLVRDNDEFTHLHHLIPTEGRWKLDSGSLAVRIRGIRIVFNEDISLSPQTDLWRLIYYPLLLEKSITSFHRHMLWTF
jgi:hypothetical protein